MHVTANLESRGFESRPFFQTILASVAGQVRQKLETLTMRGSKLLWISGMLYAGSIPEVRSNLSRVVIVILWSHKPRWNRERYPSPQPIRITSSIGRALHCHCRGKGIETPVVRQVLWRYRLTVRSRGFHPLNRGSIPRSVTSYALLSLVAKVLPCKQGSVVRFYQGAPIQFRRIRARRTDVTVNHWLDWFESNMRSHNIESWESGLIL